MRLQPRRILVDYLLVALACALIYLPRLGATGFSNTEGHRVIPAWQMLEDHDFLLPKMFGQVYLRKPPGMTWAIALSSFYLGETEFAARFVSAISITLLALLNARAAQRWFSLRATGGLSGEAAPASALPGSFLSLSSSLRSPALWAGLVTALTPLFWPIGRSAEIEALNTLASTAAVVFLFDLLLKGPERTLGVTANPAPDSTLSSPSGLFGSVPSPFGATLAITLALFAKGPAAVPAIAGAIASACIVRRSLKPLARPALWLALALPVALFLLYILKARAALAASGHEPILQSPSDFLWSAHALTPLGVFAVLAMPLLALLSALPSSLALLFSLSPSLGITVSPSQNRALALSLTTLLSLALLALLGVSNPRYALPSLGFLPILAGYAATQLPPRLARTLPAAAGALLAAAIFYIAILEHRARASTGREPGLKLAESLPPVADVQADGLIEARPETLLYAQRAAAAHHQSVTFRWIPSLARRQTLPSPGTYLILRTDREGDESSALSTLMPQLERISSGSVHKFDFTLYRVREAPHD